MRSIASRRFDDEEGIRPVPHVRLKVPRSRIPLRLDADIEVYPFRDKSLDAANYAP